MSNKKARHAAKVGDKRSQEAVKNRDERRIETKEQLEAIPARQTQDAFTSELEPASDEEVNRYRRGDGFVEGVARQLGWQDVLASPPQEEEVSAAEDLALERVPTITRADVSRFSATDKVAPTDEANTAYVIDDQKRMEELIEEAAQRGKPPPPVDGARSRAGKLAARRSRGTNPDGTGRA